MVGTEVDFGFVTGLIYVAIIAVWAVVLVPTWLRRHDRLDPQRSVSKFSRAMQTLADRSSVLGIPIPQDENEASPRRASTSVDSTPAEVFTVSRPDLTGATARLGAKVSGASAQAQTRVRHTSAAARRRVVLAVLGAALAVVAGFVAVGVLLPIALLAPTALIGGFLVASRRQVRAEQARRTRRPSATVAAPVKVSAPAVHRAPVGATGPTWEARPTTLPTYVTAPPAAGFPRVIDTATPGAWTAAAMLERAQQEKARAERMAAAKAEAIAKAKAEQAAAEARSRDEEYLARETAAWEARRRRAVNE